MVGGEITKPPYYLSPAMHNPTSDDQLLNRPKVESPPAVVAIVAFPTKAASVGQNVESVWRCHEGVPTSSYPLSPKVSELKPANACGVFGAEKWQIARELLQEDSLSTGQEGAQKPAGQYQHI